MRPNPMVLRRVLLIALFTFLLPTLAGSQQSGKSKLTVLKGNTHPLARAEFDRGAAPSNLPLDRMLLVLQRSAAQEKALEELLDEQQDKSSPDYHSWLTPEEFGRQFGPADQDIQTITNWLGSQGFQVSRVAKGRMVIEFSGTAGQVKQAFHTEIHQYEVNGEKHWANAQDPQIPGALAPVVAGPVSLHNFPRKPVFHTAAGFTKTKKPTGDRADRRGSITGPLFTAGGGCGLNGTSCYAVAPYDFATIYNILPLWNAPSPIDGTGQTIAIVSQSDVYIPDISDFRSSFGLPPPNLNIIHDGPDPGIIGMSPDETESDLDVQWSGAVAKRATIDLVVSESTNSSAGVDLSALYIVDNNLAPILSESYGACELDMGTAGNQFYSQLWQQAAAQGISVFVSTGDSGSATCDRGSPVATQGLAVNGISSTPYNVAVGGTDFDDLQNPTAYWNATNNPTTQASAKGYVPEMTWNDTCTNSEFFQFTGRTTAESDCNDTSSIFWPSFLVPVGGTGGASNCTISANQSVSSCAGGYAKPSWQTGTGVPNDGKRDVPDVSLFAGDGLNANMYAICETDLGFPCANKDANGALPIGGTSASAPTLAGIMAMVNQKMQSRQGNSNYVFYALAAQPGASCNSTGTISGSCIFYDVTAGTIAMPCMTGTPDCVTNVTGDQNGVLSGYSTTAGYDLATGLGTLNVANLVNSWGSVSFRPTTTSVTLNPTSQITHGSPVNANITVEPKTGTGTPTGLVSLLTSAGSSAGTFTLANGSVSAATSILHGGSYTVTAHYAGDGTYAASDSSPGVPVAVSPEPSTTVVQALSIDQNGNSVPFTIGPYGGKVVYLRANVAGQSGQGNATGTVTFTGTQNGTPLNVGAGSLSLNSQGYAMFVGSTPPPYPYLDAGDYSVVASYSGDASFDSSVSPALSFTVTKAPTSTAISFSVCITVPTPCFALLGTNVTIFATLSGSLSVSAKQPTGTMTFYSNGTQIGSPVPVDSNSVPSGAGLSTNQLPLGQNNITAQYSGDRNHTGSTSPVNSINMLLLTQLGLTASSPTIQAGQNVIFTAQVTPTQSGGPVPTGTVTFTANGVSIGSAVKLSTSGGAQITTSSLPSGSVQITANYSGDSDYLSSWATLNETVGSPTFVMIVNPMTITVASPGQTGSTTLTFTGQNGFAGVVTLAASNCANLPPESSCTFSPSIVGLAPSTPVAQATLMISTTAPSAVSPASWRLVPGSLAAPSVPVFCAIGMCILLISRHARQRWRPVLALVGFAAMASAIGCGGGGGEGTSNPGTPVGTYRGITVTVTINNVTQTINGLTLNVQ